MHDVLAHSLSGCCSSSRGPGCSRWPARPTSGWPGPSTAPTSWPRTAWTRHAGPSACSATTTCPGPDRLAALTAAFQADTGVPARFSSSGTPRELASAVRLALYRVTQEALTNVRKHAHPDHVEVRLAYLPDLVQPRNRKTSVFPRRGARGYGGAGGPPREQRGVWGGIVPPGRYGLIRDAGAGPNFSRRDPGMLPRQYRLPGAA
jgi:hypothetical protein